MTEGMGAGGSGGGIGYLLGRKLLISKESIARGFKYSDVTHLHSPVKDCK
jgi:hypothetical protein